MCDTFVALGGVSTDGALVFGKNSDREPNEAQELQLVAAAEHRLGTSLRCPHIAIPQVRHTNRMLLAKPYWIWGAEMGVNEYGVVIGNEALFTKGKPEAQPGLIGMDLLRLGLERAVTATEAVAVITDLLEHHGQAGRAGHTKDFQYDNSFLVADRRDAWVLETIGRQWVARRVRQSAAISNGLTTRGQWDLASTGIRTAPAPIDVAQRYGDPLYTRFAAAEDRQCRVSDTLQARHGDITVADAIAVLSGHADDGPDWSPARGLTGQDICMHAGFGPVRNSQTTGSMVVHVADHGITAWATATAAPCLSVFKPFWLDLALPDLGPPPRGRFDHRTLWWRHELLHRATLIDYATRRAAFAADRAELQRRFLADTPPADAPALERKAVTAAAVRRADDAESEWLQRLRHLGRPARSVPDRVRGAAYRRAWQTFDRAADLPAAG